jgi:conjugal transfer pilus assembly protein TraB
MRDKFLLLKTSVQKLTQVKQYVLLGGVCLGISGGVVSVLGLTFRGKSAAATDKVLSGKKAEKRIKIESSGTSLNPQEVWVDRLDKDRDVIKKRLDTLENLFKQLAGQTIGMEQRAVVREASSGTSSQTLDASFLKGPDLKGSEEIAKAKVLAEKPKFHRISFQLDGRLSKKIKRSIDHYVPAGSFARGVLTSGVVASTSVQASANPQPVHIQLTDFGNLPRGFKSDVKHCFLIGSAYGDLASERVFMRLEKLSCVERQTQEVIELSVDGYVAGEDGANGLRGVIVDRSGPAMRNAFVGGFFAGVGNFFGQQKSQVPTTVGHNGLTTVNPLTAQNMLEAGAGKGLGNAMEKFSDFYIKRAEQLQPVVEIEPGRRVDVVFKGGFDMNQTVYRQSVMTTHDAKRREAASSMGEANSLEMTGVSS